ncbi:MAG: fluoride efflux transporter CrcB [Flavobacteriaceae bacterium]|nr:fluoride efflux transporter CrcB [Flavobacteriaceae bacterium]MCY4266576.1 fluoride efflux transporter CrcB [Flavobacteriaceae bacterium]
MKELLLVFVGGGMGSVLRYSIGLLIPSTTHSFPYPTLIANLIGCFFVGLIIGFATTSQWIQGSLMIFFIVGFCGGLTTFSALIQQSFDFLNYSSYFYFFLYASLSFCGGLILVYLGSHLSKVMAT